MTKKHQTISEYLSAFQEIFRLQEDISKLTVQTLESVGKRSILQRKVKDLTNYLAIVSKTPLQEAHQVVSPLDEALAQQIELAEEYAFALDNSKDLQDRVWRNRERLQVKLTQAQPQPQAEAQPHWTTTLHHVPNADTSDTDATDQENADDDATDQERSDAEEIDDLSDSMSDSSDHDD